MAKYPDDYMPLPADGSQGHLVRRREGATFDVLEK